MMVLLIVIALLACMGLAFYASYSFSAGIYIKVFCKNPAKEKVVSLTFDDGPHPEYTDKVLDILKRRNIEATFFCIGKNIKENQQILKRIKEEGHLIGNHSYSHSFYFPLYPRLRMTQDLQECEKTIENITKERVTIFRPPFGVTNPTIAKVVKELGYRVVGWNIRSFDTCNSPEKVLKKIDRKLSPGSVILLHDALSGSDTLLEQIISIIDKRGYCIIPLDKLMD